MSPSGGQMASGNIAYRFFQSYGQLEARLDQLAPIEEAILTGKAYGAIGFNTPNIPVVAGSDITITISNTPAGTPGANQFSAPVVLSYTTQVSDTLLSICGQFATLAATNTTFTSAGGYAINDYGVGPYSQAIVPFPITSFICLQPFVITCTGTGNTVPQLVAPGNLNPPTLWIDQTYPAIPIYGYLPICDHLENAFASATNNLSTSKAREWTARPSELRERQWLYDQWCVKMAQYMGISIDPNNHGLYNIPSGGGPRRLMV